MQESLATEHSRELIADTFEELLNGGRITNERRRHSQTARWNRAEGSLDIVRDPLDEIGGILFLHITHLILDFFHRDFASAGEQSAPDSIWKERYPQDRSASQIATVSEIRGSHHILGVVHLLRQFRDSDGTKVTGTAACERSEADHEEVEARERNHVNGEFAKIRVQLTREAKTCRNTRHDSGNKVIKIAIRRVVEFQGSMADIVQCLIRSATWPAGYL